MTYTAEQQQTAFDAYINGNDYLKTRRGQYAERNGGSFPWLTRVDFTFIQEFYFTVGAKEKRNTIQLRADILNVGNLINDTWGTGFQNTSFNPLSATVAANGSLSYRLATQQITENGVSRTVLLRDSYTRSASLNAVWQAQFGLRYIFN
jgi:hypothetical protein